MKRWLRLSIALALVVSSSLCALLIQTSELGRRLEQGTYDRRFKIRGPLPQPEHTTITIVAIDEESYSTVDEPLIFWHQHFSRVIDALVESGAAAVGIDFIFSDVSKWDPEGQQMLLSSILRSSIQGVPVILGYRVGGQSGDPLPWVFMTAAGEEGVAYVNLTTDSDDFVRRQELFSVTEDGRMAPGFAMALARSYLEQETIDFVPLPENERTMLVNYRGVDYFRQVPFWKVLEAARKNDSEFLGQFRDRIVLIGEIADQDRHATPLYYWVERSAARPMTRTPGVAIHANAITTLVEGDFITQLAETRQYLIMLLLAGLAALLCFGLSPLTGTLATSVLVLVYVFVSQVFFHYGIWIFLVGPVAGVALSSGASQVTNYFLEGRQKRQLRSLFKRYVDDEVIKRILATPDLTLDGERKRITVLFSDIRGFTERSEGMDPEETVAQLNRYFEAMVQAIQSHHGTIDKFIGDGIMAVFGAPLDDADSDLHAVEAGRAMLRALIGLNRDFVAEGINPVGIGIGVHSGEAVVGNIGSHQKVDYTAIGDVVNTASRIEGLTRKLEADLLISSETFEALEGRIPAQYVAEEKVKGKTRLLKVYRVEV